jgi:hypothetical protein
MLKKYKSPLLLALGTILLVGSGMAAYWLLVQRTRVFGDTATHLVPQDALLTASIATDEAQWQQLQTYGTPETQAAWQKQLQQWQDEMLAANGYDYERDIQPWVGETVLLAYTNSGAGRQSAPAIPFLRQPDLLVVPIEDAARARQVLARANSQAGQWGERTYRGVRIRETQNGESPNYSVAVLGRFLVTTNNPKTTEQVIDTYKGADSVATTPGYGENLREISTAKGFAQLYLNVPAFAAAAADRSTRSLSGETVATEQPRQGIAATVILESEGMRLRGISWLKSDRPALPTTDNLSDRFSQRLPAQTLLMLSGSNLVQLWESYARGAESNPLTPIAPANLSAGLQATLDLNVEEDLLPWMDGEFALALIPASVDALPSEEEEEEQPSPILGAGIALLVEASDRERAEAAFAQLDAVMASRYQFLVEEAEQAGQTLVRWTSPLGGIDATHGWLEENVAFLTLGAPITAALLPSPEASLDLTPQFRQTVPRQPNPHHGQFFLDVERTLNSGKLNLSQLPPEWTRLTQAMNAIGFALGDRDERTSHFELFIDFKTISPPNPASEEPPSPPAPSPATP